MFKKSGALKLRDYSIAVVTEEERSSLDDKFEQKKQEMIEAGKFNQEHGVPSKFVFTPLKEDTSQ